MDSGATAMPAHPCLPARIETHIKNQGSNSSSISHDVMAITEPVPSPRRWSPTYVPRRRSKQIPSLSFIPSPVIPRVESHDFSTSLPRRPTDRGTSCMSPFRSVRRMKEPFQLMLPSSPASLDGASPAFTEKPSKAPRAPAEHTLRTWRSDQNLTSSNLEAFGLLPSPPMSDSRPASTGPELSYFDSPSSEGSDASEDEKEAEDAVHVTQSDEGTSTTTVEAYEVEKYTAYRPQLENQPRTDVMNVHQAHSEFVRQCEAGNEENSSGSQSDAPKYEEPAEPVPNETSLAPETSSRPQRARTGTASSEVSWVPSNFSYCERWLQGVPGDKANDRGALAKEFNNRRKCQIVENDPPMPELDIIPGAKALEAPLRFVVASKTKPKLVEIARQSSPSAPLAPPAALLPQTVPMTPDQRQEVSVFSPDTPLDMSDSGYGTRSSGCSFDSLNSTKADVDEDDGDAYTDPGSLTSSDSVGSTVIYERPESAQGERGVSVQPEIRSDSVSPKASPTTHSPERSSTLPEKEEEKPRLWHHEWTLDDHEWTLDELDHSVKDFPRHMLRLASPVMVYLRKNDEKALIKPFRTIFPDVTENLLDCLCAALLARNYLLSLSTIHRSKPSSSSRNEMYALDAVPTKAYSTLGIQLPSRSPRKTQDRVFGPRSAELRTHLERIVDNLLFAICGRSDPTLKSAVEVLAQVLETNA